jgi:hypothetical protein
VSRWRRCSSEDPVFGFTGACSLKTLSSFQGGVYVGSVSFLLRKVPTGFYRVVFSVQNFQSNALQLFIHNPVTAVSTPQQLLGQNLINAVNVCEEYLFRLFRILFEDDSTSRKVASIFKANYVFSVETPLTNAERFPLSDLYFQVVPNFYSAPLNRSQDLSSNVISLLASSGSTNLLSFPEASFFPISWHVHNGTSNFLCVSNPYSGDLTLNWMSSGVTSKEPLKLTQPAITILSARVIRDMPQALPLSVTLNSSNFFTVNVTYRCDDCTAILFDICVCQPVLFARAINLGKSSGCGEATISSKSSDGINSFPAPLCSVDNNLIAFRGRPQTALCSFDNLIIDSATFGCKYQLQVVNPYEDNALLAVVATSSVFQMCQIYPIQLSAASLCSSELPAANYSLFTWTGILLPEPPSAWRQSLEPTFIDLSRTNSLQSIRRSRSVSLIVNVCGGSVHSTTQAAFQPNLPHFLFSNPDIMQLQVNVSSSNQATGSLREIASCLVAVYRGLPNRTCSAYVISGNCIIVPMPNNDTCNSNFATQSAFFCQNQFNPSGNPDLQLQLFFNSIAPASVVGTYNITVSGSGSNSGFGDGRFWGFAPPGPPRTYVQIILT